MSAVISQISVGLSIASILLLVSLGLAIIYGTMGVINLAHGEFVMLGAYSVWFLQSLFGLNLITCLPIVFVLVGVVGLLIEWLLIRHLYTRPLDTILATWGVGVILQQAIRLSAGAELRYVKMPDFLTNPVHIGFYEESAYRIFIFFIAFSLVVITYLLIFHTEYGMRLRAITQNREIARCFGINAGRIYALTFAYGAGLAGIAGRARLALEKRRPRHGNQLCRGRLSGRRHGRRAEPARDHRQLLSYRSGVRRARIPYERHDGEGHRVPWGCGVDPSFPARAFHNAGESGLMV